MFKFFLLVTILIFNFETAFAQKKPAPSGAAVVNTKPVQSGSGGAVVVNPMTGAQVSVIPESSASGGVPSTSDSTEPNSAKDNLDSLISKIKGCMWVDSIDESSEPSDASAYQVPGCGGALEQEKKICTGTLKCSFYSVGGAKVLPVFFENVMCSSTGSRCPAAIDCLKDGGALKSVALRDHNESQIYRPNSQSNDQKPIEGAR